MWKVTGKPTSSAALNSACSRSSPKRRLQQSSPSPLHPLSRYQRSVRPKSEVMLFIMLRGSTLQNGMKRPGCIFTMLSTSSFDCDCIVFSALHSGRMTPFSTPCLS